MRELDPEKQLSKVPLPLQDLFAMFLSQPKQEFMVELSFFK